MDYLNFLRTTALRSVHITKSNIKQYIARVVSWSHRLWTCALGGMPRCHQTFVGHGMLPPVPEEMILHMVIRMNPKWIVICLFTQKGPCIFPFPDETHCYEQRLPPGWRKTCSLGEVFLSAWISTSPPHLCWSYIIAVTIAPTLLWLISTHFGQSRSNTLMRPKGPPCQVLSEYKLIDDWFYYLKQYFGNNNNKQYPCLRVYVVQIHVDLSSRFFFGFCWNRTDDIGIDSSALWPNEIVLHRLGHLIFHLHWCPIRHNERKGGAVQGFCSSRRLDWLTSIPQHRTSMTNSRVSRQVDGTWQLLHHARRVESGRTESRSFFYSPAMNGLVCAFFKVECCRNCQSLIHAMQRNEKLGICCPNSSFFLNLWQSPTRMMHRRSKLIFLLVLSSKQHYLSLMRRRQKSAKCVCRDTLLLSCKAQISVRKTYSDWPLP